MKRNATYITRRMIRNGVELALGHDRYKLFYPEPVWSSFPSAQRPAFADALVYALTLHLCLMRHRKIIYGFPYPAIEPYVFESMIYSLGETTLVSDDNRMSDLLKLFYNRNLNIEFIGRPRTNGRGEDHARHANRAVVPLSFGKDSLLTLGLCKELGINTYPVFFSEPQSPIEVRHVRALAHHFSLEFERTVTFFPVSTGGLRQTFGNWWGWDLLFTQYTLMLIPFLFYFQAGHLFWSHEQDCNDVFTEAEGFTLNPVFEQSRRWLYASNYLVREFGSLTTVSSLIQPLHEIASIWLLHHRYPDLAKYQFSCFAEERAQRARRWCGLCVKCAMTFIYLTALGFDPKAVGLTEDLLAKEKKALYFLFQEEAGSNLNRRSGVWRDEHLLAFLLAYRRGVRGDLMELFSRRFLAEAEAREKELRLKYFSLHLSDLPGGYFHKRLREIFRAEIAELNDSV